MRFEELSIGDKFRYHDGYYMKTESLITVDDGIINAVCLVPSPLPLISAGILLRFDGDKEVEATDEV